MEVDKSTAQGAGICGVILVVCGVASSISGFVWVGIHGYGGFGVWSGIGLVVAGILGIVAWWKRHKGVDETKSPTDTGCICIKFGTYGLNKTPGIKLVGFLVVTIIMIFVAAGQAITSGVLYGIFKTFVDPGKCYKYSGRCVCNHGFDRQYYVESFCDQWDSLVNALLAITIFNVIGAIVCLAGSIFGCMGACGAQQSQPRAVVVQQPAVVMTTTQHGYAAQQPGYPQAQQQPGYAPQQQPGYAPQQQPGYAPQQQPGYAPQPAAAYPPPQYKEKQ